MEIISWSDKYSVGVAEIDAQHKKLVVLLNELVSSMAESSGQKVLAEILARLVDYSQYHFRTEETYMEKFNYDGMAEHLKEHGAFREKAGGFLESVERGEELITADLLEFVWEWLKNHIAGMDQKYGACFREHGLK